MDSKLVDAWPLQWPIGYPRTKEPKRANFKSKPAYTGCVAILAEIKRLGGQNAVVSSDIPLRKDGLPHSDWQRRQLESHGVAVYFTYQGEQVVLACDKWNRIEDNIRAVFLSIEAMRGLERWGTSDILKRAFTGFKALPAGSHFEGTLTFNSEPYSKLIAPKGPINWALILGVKVDCTFDQLKAMYREKCRHCHPDTAEDGIGDRSLLEVIQKAYEAAKAERGFK